MVLGGGIAGACTAWDAALRGLSVALVERADFGAATSANSFKVVHGGIRYLQHGDLVRVRESVRERTALLRIAPHLVEPLPFVVPTYGHGRHGKALLGAGLRLYDLLTADRNRGLEDPARRIPGGRLLSRAECLQIVPGLEPSGLTGAAVFHDGQIYNPTRLVLSFLRSAAVQGAMLANYVEALSLLTEGDRVRGVVALNRLTDETFEVRGKAVVNATGPWAPQFLRDAGVQLKPAPTFSRDACLVVRRSFPGRNAVAVAGKTRDPDAVFSRGARHLFLVPWRDYTLVGVWHTVHRDGPDDFRLAEREVQGFLQEVNASRLDLGLSLEDVSHAHAGLVLFGENRPGARDLRYGKRSRVVDHGRSDGRPGLFTALAVRYTVGRRVARRVVDLVFRSLGRRAPASPTAVTPIFGGGIRRFDDFCRDAVARRPEGISEATVRTLVRNYGCEYHRVLGLAAEDPSLLAPLGGSSVLGAEVLHGVREEMALRLTDVVLRRTELGTGGHPGRQAVGEAARLMADELGWDDDRVRREIGDVDASYPSFAGGR